LGKFDFEPTVIFYAKTAKNTPSCLPHSKNTNEGGEDALVPAGIRHSFIRVPFVEGFARSLRRTPPPASPIRKTRMGEEKTLWLRQESVIRSFVSHSLTVKQTAPLHSGRFVGDGREELRELTSAGIARPAK